MMANPEFRKNLWLELSPTRLTVMPLLLCAVFFLTWLTDDHAFGPTTRSASAGLFVALSLLWGTHQAAESVGREIRERTWDWTRLSAIRPWPLAWGKLFGSTAYTWLGGIFCLIVHLLASPPDPAGNARTVALLVLGALECQAIGMLTGLQATARIEKGAPRSSSIGLVILAFFFVSPLLSSMTARGGKAVVSWYGAPLPVHEFAIVSLALFWGWTLVGIRNRLRDEFRMRTLPVAWCGFVLFLMIYAAGFVPAGDAVAPVTAALITAAGLAYAAVFLERKDPVALRRIVAAGRAGEWRRVAEGLPCFALTLPFVLAAAAALAVDPGRMALDTAGTAGVRGLILAGVAFLLRDLSLVLFLRMGRRPQRAELFALLCLGVLYGLAPAILQAVGARAGTALFWPLYDHWQASAAAAVAQAAVMAWLAGRRWMEQGGGGHPADRPTERSIRGR